MCQPDDDTYRNKTHPLWSYERGCIHHTCIFCFWSQPLIRFVVFVNNERIHSTHFAFYLCISHTFYSNTQENHWNAHGCVIIFFLHIFRFSVQIFISYNHALAICTKCWSWPNVFVDTMWPWRCRHCINGLNRGQIYTNTGLIRGLHLTTERRRCKAMPSLIGCAQT